MISKDYSENNSKTITLFFIGAFISALGTHTFVSSGLAFMREAGVTMAQVGLVIMLSRAATFTVNFIFGATLDRLHPRNVILISEVINIFVTLGLIWVWPNVLELFPFFLALVFCRSALVAAISPSQQKLVKIIYASDPKKQSKAAINLNFVNFGSLVFTTLISWYAIKNGNFIYMLIFDGITFFLMH